jgi:hypothetical protein
MAKTRRPSPKSTLAASVETGGDTVTVKKRNYAAVQGSQDLIHSSPRQRTRPGETPCGPRWSKLHASLADRACHERKATPSVNTNQRRSGCCTGSGFEALGPHGLPYAINHDGAGRVCAEAEPRTTTHAPEMQAPEASVSTSKGTVPTIFSRRLFSFMSGGSRGSCEWTFKCVWKWSLECFKRSVKEPRPAELPFGCRECRRLRTGAGGQRE